MTFYLRPANVTADGDILTPSVYYYGEDPAAKNVTAYILHHVAVNDEGAGSPLADLFGGKFVPINAPIISISAAIPAIITTEFAHGLSNGDRVFISGTDGDIEDLSGIVAGATATTFNIGKNATVSGTKGRIHEVERIIKLTNFGATGVGGMEGIGPYVGIYVDTNANNRVNILYHEG